MGQHARDKTRDKTRAGGMGGGNSDAGKRRKECFEKEKNARLSTKTAKKGKNYTRKMNTSLYVWTNV